MKKLIISVLLAVSFSVLAQASNDAERLRISTERSALEAGFSREDTACYKRFLVNSCLDEVKIRRREALADLRRQEISINDQERKAKGAQQIQKTEDKASPEKQQEASNKRAQAIKDFDARIARDKEKIADRTKLQSNEKANLESAAARAKGAQDKQADRNAKQAAAADEQKKYNEKLEKAKQREARIAKDKASRTKEPVAPLSVLP